jgi:glyoxylase-like metal-dependent hydrolase (beta-lactamase superfamily II)
MGDAVAIAPGIRQLDTLLGGMDQLTAGFLVDGPMPALIETGSQSSVPAVHAALDALGLGPLDLRWIIVTHIHLDHAGAVGDLARDFPNATVVVHERGARHLVDPSRLIDSASRVYGPLLDSLYGRMTAVPADRLVAAGDGFRVDVGNGRELVLVDSPGHAKHHHAVLDEHTGTLLVGDAVGVLLPDIGVLRPATPPPDFDLDQALHSLGRFRARQPTGLALAHYGLLGRPGEVLEEAETTLREWAAVAEDAWRAGIDIAAALAERFAGDVAGVPEEHRRKLETLNGVHSNAAGFRRWLEQRAEGHPHPH